MFAADAKLQIRPGLTTALDAELDQLADALLVDRYEGIVGDEPLLDIGGQEAAGKPDEQDLDAYMEGIERKMLEDALEKARFNKTRAAELLGISFRSFRYKLKKFGID